MRWEVVRETLVVHLDVNVRAVRRARSVVGMDHSVHEATSLAENVSDRFLRKKEPAHLSFA